MKNFLTISDLQPKQIHEILNLADQLKYEKQHRVSHPMLQGKTLGIVPGSSSSRTRICLEVGMYDLGGQAVSLPADGLREEEEARIRESAQCYSRFVDVIALRALPHAVLTDFAQESGVPVLNGASDLADPCGTLADLMTIRERCGSFKGLRLCYAGPTGAAANSLIAGALALGMDVATVTAPCAEETGAALDCGGWTKCDNLADAAAGADVLYTGPQATWGEIDSTIAGTGKSDMLVLHRQPAKRGAEISEEVFAAHTEEIYDQAENKLHVIKALLVKLLLQ
ncbi:MAG: ornithine carbamoyltransferase [Clostridiales bacterium]|jgi:ornithine carbamoyltransferase|nr:ornithine carbamoyltransferase [Clostridiales bacterium]